MSEAVVDALEALVRDLGAEEADIARARRKGPDALRRLGFAVSLLGSAPRYTTAQVRDLAGSDEELSTALWRAMGFAELPDDAVALTDADVASLALIDRYLTERGGDRDVAIRFTRLLGQTMGRVADALSSLVTGAAEEMGEGLGLAGAVADAGDELGDDDVGLVASATLIPMVEQELLYLFRRHLYAAAMRRMAAVDDDHDEHVVGFADVVQFTRMSGQLPEEDLADLLEVFEAETADLIAEAGGRVVKLIGDAVMFSVSDDEAAAELSLQMVERFGGSRPQLRVGLAHGPVIARQGDLFGPTVNLASRLVSFARPGTVLIDGPLADHLSDSPAFATRSLRPRNLKGIGETAIHVLRRAAK